jgi:hypothetical protein
MSTRAQILTKPFVAPSRFLTPAPAAVLQRKCACGGPSGPEGECAECRDKEARLERRSTGGAPSAVPSIVHDVLRSAGQPLDPAARAALEPRFGHDFSRVRVHADERAAESAYAVNSLAFTVGNHIVFGKGRYTPETKAGECLLAHELTHTIQQPAVQEYSELQIVDRFEHEREAEAAAAAIALKRPTPTLYQRHPASVSRQKLGPDEPPVIERDFELSAHVFRMDAPAEREQDKACEPFPGGATVCELDEKMEALTGRVTSRVDEKNPCTKPCVEQHEAVHVKQLKSHCPQLRDCYLAVDKGKRSPDDCNQMSSEKKKSERECQAYHVSVPCVENRLKTAKDCQSSENKEYGARKLASERCFSDFYCGGSTGK